MALGANRISSLAASSFAAASARPFSGGRGIASATQGAVESADFSANINVNDNGILHYDDQGQTDANGQKRESGQQGTPFMSRSAFAFMVDGLDLAGDSASGTESTFLSNVVRGLATYENNLRVTNPATVRSGAVMNLLS